MTEIYRDINKSADERADDLLNRMSLQEKVAQMLQLPYSMIPKEKAVEWVKKGIGSLLYVQGDDAHELQALALESKHGIPIIFGIDAIHGHGVNDKATIFPSQLAAACSWNRKLVEEMGRVTAREVATDGLHWTFSPVLCLGRDTRWGRIDETFGEDPYLAGELGVSIIKGYQGDNLNDDESIIACAKHYIGYGEAVGGRDACDTEMTFRKMREVFLPPFEKAIKAGCATVMTAYGSIDGSPFTSSEKALRKILKKELGFDGFVVTDWDNVNALIKNQRIASDIGEATQLALTAGNDMIMTSAEFYDAAIKLVKDGLLDEKIIDDAVRRILKIKFRIGLFEKPEKKGKSGCIGCSEHHETSKQLSRESIVLLKNKDILPLADITESVATESVATESVATESIATKSIAVIGSNADDIRAQYGDWTYFSHPMPNPEREPVEPYFTVLRGLRTLAKEKDITVKYHKGCSILEKNMHKNEAESQINEAVSIAKKCDIIVFVVGDNIDQTGEFKDRADLSLSGAQEELFIKLSELGKPIITVLVSSKPLCLGEIAEKTDALIIAFNGGMFGGLAIAETIFGKINPSGKLPISFPRHSGQLPVYYNKLSGWHGGKYMDLPAEPLFSFGDGISFTNFEYLNLQVNVNPQTVEVSVDVKNTGNYDGAETVQIYFKDCISSVMTPEKQLIGFEKVDLIAGETKSINFTFKYEDFSLVTPDEKRITESGEFVIFAGCNSNDCGLIQVSFKL